MKFKVMEGESIVMTKDFFLELLSEFDTDSQHNGAVQEFKNRYGAKKVTVATCLVLLEFNSPEEAVQFRLGLPNG
jgi:hypothetical protein